MKRHLLLFLLPLLVLCAKADPVNIDGIYYNLIKKGNIAEVTSNPNKYSGKVVIPSTVTYEGVKYDVTSIGAAFSGCTGLTSITIPNSVTSIGPHAFNGCNGLTSITIPNSVTSIGNLAFAYCKGLTSITIPNSVTSIGKAAFGNCSSLTSITIPNSVTSIGEGAFWDCDAVTSLTIGNGVTSIGEGAFLDCDCLTSITIPNNVETIDKGAFCNLNRLTSITIGRGVTYIGEKCFAFCPELADVYCYAKNVPNTYFNAFEGSYIEYATLNVPQGSIDAYKSVEPWKSFKNIVEEEDTGINDIKGSAVTEPFDVYDMSGRKVLTQVTSLDGLPQGLYIVNSKKILKK